MTRLLGNRDSDFFCGKVARDMADRDPDKLARIMPNAEYKRLRSREMKMEWAKFLFMQKCVTQDNTPEGLFEFLREIVNS